MQPGPFILPEKVIVRDQQGNGYVIESVLGKGEFGAIYLVRDRVNVHKVYALKEVINPDKNARERFTFEGEVLKRLNHRSLPKVHQVFENDRLMRAYLLMDYISGRNLEVLRREQPGRCFTLTTIKALMVPIVDALKYLHSQDPPIVHRDIKPANIIVPSKGGEAVLADFGSAKEYVPGTATTIVGHRSPGYAALEQYRTGTSPLTDIYGLGATLYALLTGLTPIDALTRVLGSMGDGVDPLRPANLVQPTVPQGVAETLQRALSISSSDRYETIEAFWQMFTAPSTEKIPNTTVIDLYQSSRSKPAVEDTDTLSLREVKFTAQVKTRVAFRMFAFLCVMLTVGIACFAFIKGVTVLLICSLVVLLLALGVLLRDFYI